MRTRTWRYWTISDLLRRPRQLPGKAREVSGIASIRDARLPCKATGFHMPMTQCLHHADDCRHPDGGIGSARF